MSFLMRLLQYIGVIALILAGIVVIYYTLKYALLFVLKLLGIEFNSFKEWIKKVFRKKKME